MEQAKCEKCGKEFNSGHALKIHVGRMHGSKAKAVKGARRAKARKGARAGSLTCGVCGRKFRLKMHLARHSSATHGKVARRVGRPAGAASAAGTDVRSMSFDRLLALKRQIDQCVKDRVKDMVRQIRRAKAKV